MNKLLLGLMAFLFISLTVVPAFADPQLGLIADNNRKHIVRDPLINSEGVTSGWITFACQSVEGFQYSIAVKGLSPNTVYDVRAVSVATVFVPELGDLPTSDGADHKYDLGTIKTNGKGEGEVSGIIPLPSLHIFLPFGLYGWDIRVSDRGSDVLWSPSDDLVDFQVFPAWP